MNLKTELQNELICTNIDLAALFNHEKQFYIDFYHSMHFYLLFTSAWQLLTSTLQGTFKFAQTLPLCLFPFLNLIIIIGFL